MNPFEVLGVDHKSTPKDIEKAYKDLAKKYHPDINRDDPNAEKKFKEIQNAYEMLSKGGRDNGMHFRTRRPPPGFDFDFNFFTNSVFKGSTIQVQTEIELLDVLTGCDKIINYKKNVICKDCNRGFTDFLNCEQCNGTGQFQVHNGPFIINTHCNKCIGKGKIGIKKCERCQGTGNLRTDDVVSNINIPPGIESGIQLIFPGHGEESLNGGINGDLIVTVIVKEHSLFKREGADLIITVPVSYSQLCLGCNLEVPCITKEKAVVKIPENCQPSSKFKVKGKGVFFRGTIGDMIVCLKLEVPKEINQEYRKILLKLSEMEKKWPSINQQNWLETINRKEETI